MNSFFEQVYAIVEKIPYGKVISYGQIARMLGRPRAAREVGWAMRHCPENLPWQRVVLMDGSITGGIYADMRKALLETEGVKFLPDGRVDMELCGVKHVKTNLHIRPIQELEYPLLEDFLYHAIFLPPGAEPLPREVVFQPEIYIYIKDFGDEHDCGVVAELDDKIIGAAWTRIIPAFGHIDDETPELAISVLPEYRGNSIGTMLMTHLFELLRERGYKQTSLAVQQKNDAVRFHQRLGYEITNGNEEEFIMVKELERQGDGHVL